MRWHASFGTSKNNFTCANRSRDTVGSSKNCRQTRKFRISDSGFRVNCEKQFSFSAHRDAERLLMFGEPGLNALADFGIRRRGVFDSIQAHSWKARLDAAVRAQEALFSEKALALHRREEIFEESRRIWVCRFLGDTDRMNADNN